MKHIILIHLFMSVSLIGQINIVLPDSFVVNINHEKTEFSYAWYDSLRSEASQNRIQYQIAGCLTSKRQTITKLKIPQTLNFNQVLRQIIYYYSILSDEEEMQKETVLVYPLFTDIDKSEHIKCTFDNRTFYFEKKGWQNIPIPNSPTPEEKYIYNQILKYALQDSYVFKDIPENALKNVSIKQNLPTEEVFLIYKKVHLWKTINVP